MRCVNDWRRGSPRRNCCSLPCHALARRAHTRALLRAGTSSVRTPGRLAYTCSDIASYSDSCARPESHATNLPQNPAMPPPNPDPRLQVVYFNASGKAVTAESFFREYASGNRLAAGICSHNRNLTFCKDDASLFQFILQHGTYVDAQDKVTCHADANADGGRLVWIVSVFFLAIVSSY